MSSVANRLLLDMSRSATTSPAHSLRAGSSWWQSHSQAFSGHLSDSEHDPECPVHAARLHATKDTRRTFVRRHWLKLVSVIMAALITLTLVVSVPAYLYRVHSPPAMPTYYRSEISMRALSLNKLTPTPRNYQPLSNATKVANKHDHLSEEWLQRLSPIRVEAFEGFAGVIINTMILTGHAHLPPLFDGLPCVAKVSAEMSKDIDNNAYDTHLFPVDRCVDSVLEVPDNGNLTVILTTHEGIKGEIVQQQYQTFVLSPTNLAQMLSDDSKRSTLEAFQSQCPLADSHDNHCSMTIAAEAFLSLVGAVNHRYWLHDLAVHHTYVVSIQHSNGTHLTAPIYSHSVNIQTQLELYNAERQRITHYFNELTEPESVSPMPTRSHASSASPSEYRHIAPFEAAMLSEQHGGKCSATFHKWIADYRDWHQAQIARLQAVKHDPAGLRAMLTTDPHPIRIIASQANPMSGLSDRTHGLLGLYLVSMLTKRVLLMADDWTDIYLSVQPSLQLSAQAVTPHLNDSSLSELHQVVPYSFDGLPIDDLDTAFNKPITFVTSIRGMQVKFLTQSRKHASTLLSLGMTSENIVGCIYHSLWVIRLSTLTSRPEYSTPMSVLLSRANVGVGIQIRSWNDAAFAIEKDQYGKKVERAGGDDGSVSHLIANGVSGFFHCAQDVSDTITSQSRSQPLNPVWLLMADDERVRSAAVQRWGSIKSPVIEPTDPMQSQLLTILIPSLLGHSSLGDPSLQLLFQQHALVEQYLFALCHRHIISRNSGFGRLPAVLGMREHKVFGLWHPEDERRQATCINDDLNGVAIGDLAKENSGL